MVVDGHGIKAVGVGPFGRRSGFGKIPGWQEETEFDVVHRCKPPVAILAYLRYGSKAAVGFNFQPREHERPQNDGKMVLLAFRSMILSRKA